MLYPLYAGPPLIRAFIISSPINDLDDLDGGVDVAMTTTTTQEDLDGENGNQQAAAKKKSPKPEESKSKKEHVNVVFIGHVGELECFFLWPSCICNMRVSCTRISVCVCVLCVRLLRHFGSVALWNI